MHPYRTLPDAAFWAKAVAARHPADWAGLAPPLDLTGPIATLGSCFARHLGPALRARGCDWLECEPAPAFLIDDRAAAEAFGFGLFSVRCGNIYTARQLRQLAEEACGERQPIEPVWRRSERRGERWVDALRPGVDPVGRASAAEVLAERALHLAAVRAMLATAAVVVVTLGQTEAWSDARDGTVYPSAPGTRGGTWDPARHHLLRQRYPDVAADVLAFRALLNRLNPAARLVLSVSPVPLAATATGGHVLTASMAAKATLRAVAGDLADDHPDIAYAPAWDLLASHPARAMMFNPDLRTINPAGVALVMGHVLGHAPEPTEDNAAICDEDALAGPLWR